ncbi:MAG: winged helix-turn-helix transcriptional regulator [Spirochaetaceae bacterium]|jgi:DNA-binding PadR family transcriptional regulator|nr:winged helix-turn-helix transcriptional regulator [Spirochaetaceae bacterium]
MKNPENELKILELISQGKDDISQRDISRIIGMSLGMTNSILKRFAEKGLITIKKVNNRNIQYALTSEGLEEVGRRSWGYFKRTIKNIVVYREAINEVIGKAVVDGCDGIALVGKSDLAFIVEHECYKLDMPFYMIDSQEKDLQGNLFLILAEMEESVTLSEGRKIDFSLNNLVF